eukprot:GHVU01127454.1.p1 GENE.GHVU01127454.1~~GHVU01127454.1.p1  ORF type:complete len:172 (+),score=1.90 GHVU01127454.1:436-951(+)
MSLTRTELIGSGRPAVTGSGATADALTYKDRRTLILRPIRIPLRIVNACVDTRDEVVTRRQRGEALIRVCDWRATVGTENEATGLSQLAAFIGSSPLHYLRGDQSAMRHGELVYRRCRSYTEKSESAMACESGVKTRGPGIWALNVTRSATAVPADAPFFPGLYIKGNSSL